MEELQPEELEELVQELEGESAAEESLSPEVEQLLRDLQPARRFTARLRAARQLGGLSGSNRQIVQALATVAETDGSASDGPMVGTETERILVQIEGETGGHEWPAASLVLEPVGQHKAL